METIVSSSIYHEMMGPDAMILVFWMLSFKPTFALSIESAKTRLGADCGSDHELLIANSDLNWRK